MRLICGDARFRGVLRFVVMRHITKADFDRSTVQGVAREESSPLTRLADALAGLVRDAVLAGRYRGPKDGEPGDRCGDRFRCVVVKKDQPLRAGRP